MNSKAMLMLFLCFFSMSAIYAMEEDSKLCAEKQEEIGDEARRDAERKKRLSELPPSVRRQIIDKAYQAAIDYDDRTKNWAGYWPTFDRTLEELLTIEEAARREKKE